MSTNQPCLSGITTTGLGYGLTTGGSGGGGSGGSSKKYPNNPIYTSNAKTAVVTGSLTYSQPVPQYSIYPSHVTTYYDPPLSSYWPFENPNLTQEEMNFIADFKKRHPDFDALTAEINLILKYKPGLNKTCLFMSVLYEMAKNIKKVIDTGLTDEEAEGIIDGKA